MQFYASFIFDFVYNINQSTISWSGAAKIVALETCIELAKKWVTSCSESQAEDKVKARVMYSDFQNSHKRALIEQTLLQNNLTDTELMNLSNDPTRLVFKLYEHNSIQQRFESRAVLHSLPGKRLPPVLNFWWIKLGFVFICF